MGWELSPCVSSRWSAKSDADNAESAISQVQDRHRPVLQVAAAVEHGERGGERTSMVSSSTDHAEEHSAPSEQPGNRESALPGCFLIFIGWGLMSLWGLRTNRDITTRVMSRCVFILKTVGRVSVPELLALYYTQKYLVELKVSYRNPLPPPLFLPFSQLEKT